MVIATENPVGSSGTQLLPESQLDRFMISVSMGYPDHQSLVELLRDRQKVNPLEHAKTVLTREEVLNLQKKVQEVYVADVVLDYIAKLAEATRDHELITLGLSPRGTLALCRMTKAAAYMKERDYVVPQDVKDVFKDVAAHRMILDSKARYQEKTAREILDEILDSVPEPKDRRMMKNRIMWLLWLHRHGRSHSGDRLMADGGSASAFCITADLIGSSHQSGRQKNRNKIICAKSSGAK